VTPYGRVEIFQFLLSMFSPRQESQIEKKNKARKVVYCVHNEM